MPDDGMTAGGGVGGGPDLIGPPIVGVGPPGPGLPPWIPPADTGQPAAIDLNDLSLHPKQNFAARNSIIPISYGRDRVFGKLIVVHVDEVNGFLYVAYSFSEGELGAFETIFVDSVDVDDGDTGFLLADGAVVEEHLGTTSQTASALLSAALPGYTDALVGTAYIVLKVPQGASQGFPRCEAILNGRKVYDPRLDDTQTTLVPAGSGAHRVGDATTWAYSTNPALCFRDMVENFTGWDILDQGVADLADHNDVLISGVKRREIGLTLFKATDVEGWVKGFRTYMGAFIGWEAGKIRVIPNKAETIPAGIAMTITADDIVKDSLTLSRRSLRSVPNSVVVEYEDSSGVKWHTERVQADSTRVTESLEARRLSRVTLPGIHNASQAQREAIERLNWYLTDLECTLTLFDEGWQLQNGSIVSVTHPIGLDENLFRVRRVTAESGRWTIDLVEYDSAIYSNEVIADPTTPATSLGDPLHPPLVTGLSAAEELFTHKNGNTGSRVRVTWDASTYPFLSQYLVEGYVEDTLVFQLFTGANDVATHSVEELVSGSPVNYEVKVYVQSPFAQGQVQTTTTDILGKLLPPSDVPSINLERKGAGDVQVTWGIATDIDIWQYHLKRGTNSDNWETATTTDYMDDTDRLFLGLSTGTHRFLVKAVDSVGNESTTAISADITLGVPDAVASISGFEVASEVRLNWPACSSDCYVARYRISYDTSPTPTGEITLDVVDTLRFQTKDVPEGTYAFSVWARDKNGVEAATAPSVIIEVTSDANAFLADTYNFDSPQTLTNFVAYDLRVDERTFYVTNMADAFAVSPSDFQVGVPVANYHSSGSALWLSEVKDFGLQLTGSWNLSHDVVALSGSVTLELELSTDDISYDVYSAAGAKGTYRYARVRITTTTTSTAFVKTPLMRLNINVVPLEESGSDNSSIGGPTTITLDNDYTALKEIIVTPTAVAVGVTAVVDNIVIGVGITNEFDVYIFDIFGQKVGEEFQWKWRAV